MIRNDTIDLMMNRKSVRAYTDEVPSDEVIETVVRAGQQAPFAMQMCSVILEREGGLPWGAPICFVILADVHRIQTIAERRGWELRTNDVSLLLLAIQDAAYMAQNMVIAAESLGLGSCFIGDAPARAAELAERLRLPPKVFPLVRLVMGYPDEEKPPRPRYPLSFSLFEGAYPELGDEEIEEAMRVMDEGFLAQDYYRAGRLMLKTDREETCTFDDYSWTEHISRKLSWSPSPGKILAGLSRCGFDLGPRSTAK
ncbi:MAG: nitroreductase family protein [Planctomycetota bacterium]|jgi:nitroreductase